MNCPEHLILDTRYCMIWHHQRADVRREYVTWREVFNPLRYEILVGSGPGRYRRWNNDAWMNRKLSNLTWMLWRKRKFEKHMAAKSNPFLDK